MLTIVRRLLRAVIPYSIVDWIRKWRTLRTIGYSTFPLNAVDVNRAYSAAKRASFDLLPPGSLPTLHTLVDVGANHGLWTESALTCASPDRVLAIEPGPAAYESLLAQFADHSRVHLHKVVAGEQEGEMDFHVTASDDLSSVLAPNDSFSQVLGSHTAVESTVKREVVPLDHLLADLDEVSVLKIDVQGFELPVLRGAQATLQKTRFVLVEMNYFTKYEGGSDFTAVHRALTDADFQLRDLSVPNVVNGRATFSDALYQNPDLL